MATVPPPLRPMRPLRAVASAAGLAAPLRGFHGRFARGSAASGRSRGAGPALRHDAARRRGIHLAMPADPCLLAAI